MRIVILTIGTFGDVQPYTALGVGLQEAGYKVCLATHEPFRDFITRNGLDFAPIAGDPLSWAEGNEMRSLLNSSITNYFKIVGRTRPRSMVLRSTKAYLEQHYDGNIFDILCSSLNAFGMTYGAYLDNSRLENIGFFKMVSTCEQRCEGCHYCQELASKLVRLGVVTREKLEDLGQKGLADRLEAERRLPWPTTAE